MRRTTVLLGMCWLMGAALSGQSCLPEGITFRSQAEVDSFRILYPGCTRIEGSVRIQGLNSDIHSLDSLSHLTRIGGNLGFGPNNTIVAVSGFDSLRSVGGSLFLLSMFNLATLDAFPRLDSIGDDLDLGDLPVLTSLAGFDSLTHIGGDLTFIGLGCREIEGFNKLRYVQGDFGVAGNSRLQRVDGFSAVEHVSRFSVIGNDSLMLFRGLPLVDSIAEHVRVRENPLLDSILALSQVEIVQGNVDVMYNDRLPDLSFLGALERVEGILYVAGNHRLENLHGLQLLRYVGDRLLIVENGGLTDISQLSRLDTVVEVMTIQSNPSLRNLVYPSALSYVYDVMITDNDSLTAITGLAGHHEIRRLYIHDHDLLRKLVLHGTSLHQVGYLEVRYNDGLDSLSIAPKEFWAMSVSVEGNPNLRSIQVQGAQMTGLTLRISDNDALENLQGLDSIAVIKLLSITNNPVLSDFSGLGSLRSVNDILTIRGNPAIVNFTGMESLQRVGYGMSVSENASLLNMEGLGSLESVGNTFFITRNPALVNFQGMDAFREASGLSVQDNPALESFAGLGTMTRAGFFQLFNNDLLTDFSGLEGLREVGDFPVRDNDHLTSFAGLTALEEIGGLEIERNPALQSLDGLTSITAIHHYLQLIDNPVLEDLQAIGDVYMQTHNYTDVTIRNCPALAICALPSICYYISNSDRITIDSNAVGCNSVAEVEAQCLTPVESVPSEEVRIYPNPATDILHFSSLGDTGFKADIFDASGRRMGHTDLPYLDVSGWPAGMYQVHIRVNGDVVRRSFVKM